MQTTTNYGYNVPESGDAANITKISENFTSIDSDLKSVSDASLAAATDLGDKIDAVGEKVDEVGTKVDNVNTTIEGLPQEVQNQLNAFKATIDELKKNVEDTLADVQETVENSPAGAPAPALKSFSAESQEDGIKITFTAHGACTGKSYGSEDNYDDIRSITKGVMFRYSDSEYPLTHNDGNLGFYTEDIYTISSYGTRRPKEVSGVITGLTNGKTYYISAFPYSNYNVFNDGAGVMQGNGSVNRQTCQWTGTKGTLTVNVTQDYDCKPLGEYTATMTPTAGGEAITKTQSGSATVVFIGLEAGEYTLSFSAPQYFTAPQSESVTVVSGQSQTVDKVFTFSAGTLSDASWELIDELSKQASNFWSIGDTKDIVVSGETITVEIIGFNHDDLSDGSGKAGITFGMKNLMANQKRMNRKNTNAGSYAGSEMNTYVGTTFYNGMPAEVRNVIKSVKKVTGNSTGSGSWTGTRTDNFKTWLFSEAEVFGTKKHSVGNEGSKYARFTSNSLRIKKLSNGSSAYDWWLRSPILDNTSAFCGVNTNGDGSSYNATYSSGVCVGFCV